MNSTLIRGGTIVTMNRKRQVFKGDIRFSGGVILEVSNSLKPLPKETVVEAENTFVIPGLIQAHTHLVQTLFRGWADDLELLDWLKKKIWPMEHAHTEASLRASARIGLLEMQLAGTTAILDMGTVRDHEIVFDEAARSGMRYWGGNCLMDLKGSSGPLYRATKDSLAYSEELIKSYHGKGLLQYAVSPRFVISCTDQILNQASQLQKKFGLIFHTHASENKTEVALVKKRTGMGNVQFLNKIGCLHERTVIAHGIHLSKSEMKAMINAQAGLCHCPSSNLKLASGIARIHEYRKMGMKVALGSDGAPCNNSMDPFLEMRLAALLQKPIFGPTSLPAQDAFEMATLGGARALCAEKEIGSLEKGKRADIVLVKRDHPSVATVQDPYSALVYSCLGRDVRDVWIEGKEIVRESRHQIFDVERTTTDARNQLAELFVRQPRLKA